MERIDSLSNAKVKLATNLLQRKYRDKEGLFILEGLRNAELVVESHLINEIQTCFVTEELLENLRCKNIISKIHPRNVYLINDKILGKISDAVSPQGIILIVRQKKLTLEMLNLKSNRPILVLDKVMDPGNMGTIIRTADAMGIESIITVKGSADIYSPKVIRSAMGSIFALPIVNDLTMEKLQAFLKNSDRKILVTALDETAKSLYGTDLREKVFLVVGNEANGVSNELLNLADEKLYIPMNGKAESLNVAIATAMILSEYQRQCKYIDVN